ncbi:site-specific integrase [Protofrankia sp. BMG5.30]|nr:site-specific integrase [Protofrankia sp. BMG5.30]
MMAKKRRRGNGEGAIYKGSDGRWRATVDLGWVGGKRQRKYLSGRTRAEVADRLRTLHRQQEDGVKIVIGDKPLTVEQWLTHWVDHIAPGRVRPSTLATYRGYVRNRITPVLGRHRLDRLEPEHVEAWRNGLLDAGLAAATVLQCFRILSRALKVAVQRGKVTRNVCTLVDAPSVDRDEVQPLTAGQARQVLTLAVTRPNGARWSVALALGLRQGEALGLPWDAVDLDAGTLTVRQALQRRPWQHGCADDPCKRKRGGNCPKRHGGGFVIVRPKSRAGRRTITLPSPLVTALRAHREHQDAERDTAGDLWKNEHGLVFTRPDGHPIDPAADWREWKALAKDAGVAAARLHDARHTAASLLLAQGVPARVAMEILGHSQIGLTLGTYSHVAPELRTDAATRMGEALWGSDNTPTAGEPGNSDSANGEQADDREADEGDQTPT